jgi:hypothetical protein
MFQLRFNNWKLGGDYDAPLKIVKHTTNRLLMVVVFSLLSVAMCGSVATGDLLNAPKGGRYGDVRRGNTGGQVHHTPASAVSPYTHHTGPSVWMETLDHRRTGSWGSSAAAKAYRQKQADLIAQGKLREAVQMDIDDIRSKFGSKYDDHIREMLEEFGDEF